MLKAISEMPCAIFSKETAIKFDLGPTSSTQKVLKSLLEQGIIDKLNNQYVFTDPLYQLFVKQNL